MSARAARWQLAPLAAARPQPWRNGGGVTRELLAWPAAEGWQVRISLADVAADGPFSFFPRVERWFAVLEGEGVKLRLLGREHRVERRSEPFHFDGEAEVRCKLVDGPTRDLNLMALRGRGSMQRVTGAPRLHCAAPRLVALYAHADPAVVVFGDDRADVPPATLAWRVLDTSGPVQVDARDAMWMEVRL